MDFLGIGPLEVVFIVIIALIIFGPNDIIRAGKTMGRFMRKVVTSDAWRAFQQASKGMRDIPTTLMREAGLEENDLRELTGMKDLEEATKDLENQISPWTTPPNKTLNIPANSPVGKTKNEPSQSQSDSLTPSQEASTLSEEKPAPPPDSPFSQTIDDND
jgi:Sec-independent protein translocase protein TatA